MDKRYQVFVSSTYEDLKVERKEVTEAILRCDCFPAGMELFPASSREKWDVIKKSIDDSDIFLAIIAGRYGSFGTDEDGNEVGYTEMEFDYAQSRGKPVIALLHRNLGTLPSNAVDGLGTKERNMLDEFRKRVQRERMVKYWSNQAELGAEVGFCLSAIMRDPDTKLVGWTRSNDSSKDVRVAHVSSHVPIDSNRSVGDDTATINRKTQNAESNQTSRNDVAISSEKRMVLVSHSQNENDNQLAKSIVESLLHVGIDSKDIICFTNSGFTASSIMTDLEFLFGCLDQNIKLYTVFILSDKYLEQRYCILEMGAALACSAKYSSVVVSSRELPDLVRFCLKNDSACLSFSDKEAVDKKQLDSFFQDIGEFMLVPRPTADNSDQIIPSVIATGKRLETKSQRILESLEHHPKHKPMIIPEHYPSYPRAPSTV